jgi:hypothetical protein
LLSYSFSTLAIPDACREWKTRIPVTQNGVDFRREFATAQWEQRIISSTASSAGSHPTNVAEHYVHSSLPAHGGFVSAMANLSTTSSADRETMATLTKAITTLTEQLKAKDMLAKYQEAELK